MRTKKVSGEMNARVTADQIARLQFHMQRLAERNPSWGIAADNWPVLYQYLAAKKITYLYDDELYEKLVIVDHHQTGIEEELLDAYMVLDTGDEVQLKLFQFKFTTKYDGGISTKELYAFVDRMNRVFLRGDLEDADTLQAYKKVREAFKAARDSNHNRKAKSRIHCYYVVNGQTVSVTDREKVDKLRDIFKTERQSYGFTFEAYGGLDIYNLCETGRVPIQDEALDLNHDTGPNPYLHYNIGANPIGMPIQVVQGFVNVNQLTRLVDRYSNNELFERNVRFFLGAGKDVNRRIIETITSNDSGWFGFMNNGVSITADDVHVDVPPSGKKLRVRLRNMQIINGCQTVNALYHAKYDPELRDKFQGNSNVLVRIYHIDPANDAFMRALIIATNSQNAIRAEDLVANDTAQIRLQNIFREYGIGYERKEGESLPQANYLLTLTKETAAMAYMAVYWTTFASRLRNSASRKVFFSRSDEYNKVFQTRDETATDNDDNVQQTSSGEVFTLVPANQRAMEMLAAHKIELVSRQAIAATPDKRRRGSLRKAAYFLSRLIYCEGKREIDAQIAKASIEEANPKDARILNEEVGKVAIRLYPSAVKRFDEGMKAYIANSGGDEDAALKNTEFAKLCEKGIPT